MKSPIHFYITDKILVITQNKVASRYTSALLYPHAIDASFCINSNFEIFDDFIDLYQNQKNIKNKYVIDEFNNIFEKKSNKDILFLYRNPFDRVLSGIIQEFYSMIYDEDEYYDFKLKFILKNHYNCESLYYKLTLDKLWYSLDFNNSNGYFIENELKVLSNLLLEYIIYFSNTPITHTDHTYNYLKSMYNVLHDDSKIDRSRVSLINIGNGIDLISSYCERYHILEGVDVPSNSNKFMKDLLSSNYLDSESINLLNISLEKIKLSLIDEYNFYDKLIKSDLNFKSK